MLPSLAAAETAETAAQIFSRVRHSIVALEAVSPKGKTHARGSGLAITVGGQVVTSCEVADGNAGRQTHWSGKTFKGFSRYEKQDLGICQLEVTDLQIPPVALGTAKNVRVRERGYALGMSSEPTPQPVISTAEISSVRPYEGSWYMRISAVLSPGFRGGGLFNERGELIGILSPQRVEGENLTFAFPVDWMDDMEKHAPSASGTRKEGGLDWSTVVLPLKKKGDWPGLLKLSEQQVKRDPGSAAAWFGVGTASAHLKQYNQAVHAYREAIRNQAEYGEAWHKLGVAYANLKEYDHAIHAYRDALRIQRDNAEVWYGLGDTHYELKQYAHAIHAYREALRIQPENPNAWYKLGIPTTI